MNQLKHLPQLILFLCTLSSFWIIPNTLLADLESPEVALGSFTQDLKVGPGMNAAGRNLAGCRFINIDLSKANFDGANFRGCKIFQCNLKEASFRKANFYGLWWNECEIEGADFTDAILNGTESLHRSGVEILFSSRQLKSTLSYKQRDFTGCTIGIAKEDSPPSLDFQDAIFKDAEFGMTDLRDCNFTNARLTDADFYLCKMTSKQLKSTYDYKHKHFIRLTFGTIDGPIDLSGFNLYGSSYLPRHAEFSNSNITNCSFYSIPKEQLETTKNFQEGQLTGINFNGQQFTNVDLSGQNLSNSSFRGRFHGANLTDAVISNCKFSEPTGIETGLTIKQIKSTWNYKNNRMAGIKFPEELAKALEAERAKEKE
ncbi:MAG: hypothetical protein COA78_09685 [Blastopirellula sp.]|nr:MAG: hypothetical protein COA78_09685 [Blastopirellula sp.]